MDDKVDLSSVNKEAKASKRSLRKRIIRTNSRKGPQRDEEGKFTSGNGGLNIMKSLNWKRAIPLIIIVLLVGGFSVYRTLATTSPGWKPGSSAVTVSSDVLPVVKKEGLAYWYFDIPTIPPLPKGKVETQEVKYSNIGTLTLKDSNQGAGEYCANIQTFTAPIRVRFSGANVQITSDDIKKDGYFYIGEKVRKDYCVMADLSAGPLAITLERVEMRDKPKTHAIIHRLTKEKSITRQEPGSDSTSLIRPTPTNTGPRVANPQRYTERIHVYSGEVRDFTDTVINSIFVHPGGQVTIKNSKIEGAVFAYAEKSSKKTKLHISDSSVFGGLRADVITSSGNLDWSEVPIDLVVSGTYIYHPQGNRANGDHTEAVAGFGWPKGARFERSTFVQQGPMNYTATGTINWSGVDTVFDTIWFDWTDGTAAFWTTYIKGRNNVVKNSYFAKGLGDGYAFSDDGTPATYINNRDLKTGQILNNLPDADR